MPQSASSWFLSCRKRKIAKGSTLALAEKPQEEQVAKAAKGSCCVVEKASKVTEEVKVDGPGDCRKLRGGGVVLRRRQSQDKLEVLLVTRRHAPNSHTLPAGKFEDHLDAGSFEACALRET